MKILRVRVAALATVAGVALLGGGITAAQASSPPAHKVTLCHRTGSVAGGNTHAGYSIITVDIASVANAKSVRGHDGHNSVGNGPDGDIIPSYTYVSKNGSFTYPGKNLDQGGAAFLANGCKTVTPPPSSSSSSSSTTTTTSTTSSTTSSTTTSTTPSTTTSTTTSTTPSTTTSTTSATTPGTSTSTTTGTSSSTTPVTGATPVVAGTVASTTPAPPTTSPDVLGASATAANPLPAGAAAGQANTGKFIAGGLTGLAALLALGAGFVLRRRHAVS